MDLDSEEEKVVKPEKQEDKIEEKGEKGKRKKKVGVNLLPKKKN